MTLENYVLEQSINTASVGDIMLEQAIAEFEVANKILECYQKEEVLQEYCSDDVSMFNIFLEEADESDSTKKSFKDTIKSKGNSVLNWFQKIWNMITTAIQNFMNRIFLGPDLGKIADKIDNKYDDSARFHLNVNIFNRLKAIREKGIKVIEDSLDFCRENATSISADDIDLIKGEIEDYYKAINYRPDGNSYTHEESVSLIDKRTLVAHLHELAKERQVYADLQTSIKNYVKEINKWLKNPGEGQESKDPLPAEFTKTLTSFANELVRDFRNGANEVAKAIRIAENTKNNKESANLKSEYNKAVKNSEKESKKAEKKAKQNAKNTSNDDSEDEE